MPTPTPPREGHASLGGHPWLARMLDKARLDAQGTIDELDLVFPCPMDRSLLGKLGMAPEDFQRIAVENTTDEAVLAALSKAGAPV